MPDGVRVHAFSYLEYRAFLRDLFAAKKAAAPSFSHRAFSRRAGLRSTNYLHLVVAGKRNLTPVAARSFAKGFGLAKDESNYFCALVRYNQAKVADERAEAFAALGRFRKFREVHELATAQSAYQSTWYLPAIRELAARRDFREDPKWIAERLVPRISAQEARRAVALLMAATCSRVSSSASSTSGTSSCRWRSSKGQRSTTDDDCENPAMGCRNGGCAIVSTWNPQ